MLCGNPPFNGSSDKIILDKIAKGKYGFEEKRWVTVSESAKNFIRKMMDLNTETRYTADQALRDPWLEKCSHASEIDEPLTKETLQTLKSFSVIFSSEKL